MASDLLVSLILKARNSMSPELEKARQDAKRLKDSISSLSGMKGPGNIFNKFNSGATEAIKKLDAIQNKMKSIQDSGLRNILDGVAIMSPAIASVKAAGDFQQAKTEIEIAGYDASVSEKVRKAHADKLGALANRLGSDTKFDNIQAAQTIVALQRGGLDYKNIYNGAAKASMYLAQAANIDPVIAANSVTKIGGAYQLKGKQYTQLADYISRVDGASTASVDDIMVGFRYAASTAKDSKVSYKELGAALAVLNNKGLDGSTAGSNFKDALKALVPKTKQARDEFKKAGLIDRDGNNILLDKKDGGLKDLKEVKKILNEKMSKMSFEESEKFKHAVFGEEGSNAMSLFLQNGKGSYEDVIKNINKQMSIDERVKRQQKDFNARVDEFKGSWKTLLTTIGTPALPWLTEKVNQMSNMVEKVQKWSNEHKDATKNILATVGAIGGLIATAGAAKVAFGAFRFALSPLKFGAKAIKFASGKFKTKPKGTMPGARRPRNNDTFKKIQRMNVTAARVYVNGPITGGGGGTGGNGRGKKPKRQKGKIVRKSPIYMTPNIREKKTWKDRLKGLGRGSMKGLSRGSKALGVVGTVASVGFTAYDMYQASKQVGWKKALGQNGGYVSGSSLGALGGGALGALLGPAGAMAGAAAGGWLGGKAGGWLDKKGYTKKAVNSTTKFFKNPKVKAGAKGAALGGVFSPVGAVAGMAIGSKAGSNPGINKSINKTINQSAASFKKLKSAAKGWWKGGDAKKAQSDLNRIQKSVTKIGPSFKKLKASAKGWWKSSDSKKAVTDLNRIQKSVLKVGPAFKKLKSATKGWWKSTDANKAKTDLNNIKKYADNAGKNIKKLGQSAKSGLDQIVTGAKNAGKSFDGVTKAVASAANKTKASLSSIKTIVSQGKSWGSNLITMIASGITSSLGTLKSAVSKAASVIKSNLGFASPTKEGPASRSDRWAPNFMHMFAGGIDANVSQVAMSAKRTAAALKRNVQTTAKARIDGDQPQFIAGGGGGYNDNRKISIVIQANNADDAQRGVEKALGLPPKYQQSRGMRKPAWG